MSVSLEQLTKVIGELEGNKLFYQTEKEIARRNIRRNGVKSSKIASTICSGNISAYDTAIKLLKELIKVE